MRMIICLTTVLAFALHMGLGCCSHHAHAEHEQTACQHQSVGHHASHESSACGHSHSHAHQDHALTEESQETPASDSCPHKQCQGGKCVFVSLSKISLSYLTNFSLLPISLDESQTIHCGGALTLDCDSGGPQKLPIRLHLFHQILLI